MPLESRYLGSASQLHVASMPQVKHIITYLVLHVRLKGPPLHPQCSKSLFYSLNLCLEKPLLSVESGKTPFHVPETKSN